MGNAMLVAAVTIFIIMFSTWVISLVVKNASIVDIVWGAGFAITSWFWRSPWKVIVGGKFFWQ